MAAQPMGPAAETRELTAPDGVRIFTARWDPVGPERGALLLVHGLKDHSGRYGTLVRAMQGAGISVHALDLRGHGRSGGDRQWVRSFDEYTEDLDRLAAPLMAVPRPLFVLGHSMGGAIVLRWIACSAPRLAGVVLSAPAILPPLSVPRSTQRITRFLSWVVPRARLFDLPLEDFSRDPAVVAAMTADPLIDPRPAPVRTGGELLRTMAGFPSAFPKFTFPVLALHGSEDRLTNPAGSQELIDRVGSQDKTLQRYEGLYHDLLHEPEGDVVLGDITRWISEHVATTVA
jgi:acylglycerol lipase